MPRQTTGTRFLPLYPDGEPPLPATRKRPLRLILASLHKLNWNVSEDSRTAARQPGNPASQERGRCEVYRPDKGRLGLANIATTAILAKLTRGLYAGLQACAPYKFTRASPVSLASRAQKRGAAAGGCHSSVWVIRVCRLLGFAFAAEHVYDLVLVETFHLVAGRTEVFTRVELRGFVVEHLADGRRHCQAGV